MLMLFHFIVTLNMLFHASQVYVVLACVMEMLLTVATFFFCLDQIKKMMSGMILDS
jgi:hypothetical protein